MKKKPTEIRGKHTLSTLEREKTAEVRGERPASQRIEM